MITGFILEFSINFEAVLIANQPIAKYSIYRPTYDVTHMNLGGLNHEINHMITLIIGRETRLNTFITRTQLCTDVVQAFADCSKNNGFSMVVK